MAKKKENKVPKIPAKQQMYEQILTKQLYGAPPTREEGIAKLQADYDAWNERQQGIAKLQSDYDSWLNEQKKAQQPVKAPKVETVKAPVQQTPTLKKNKVETIAPKSEEKKYLTHADVIPSLNKKSVEKQTQMNKVAQNNAASVAKIAKQLGVSEDEVKQRMTAPKQELNAYNEKKIDKNTTESMQKAASEKKRKAAQKKYNPWEAFTGRFAKATTDIVNAPLAIAGKLTGKDLSIYNDAQKQEFKDIQEQHPVASTAGDLAGMAFAAYALGGGSKGTTVPQGNVTSGQVFKALRDDAILNGATKGRATAQALKGALPTLAANAASNMPTDFAVDIIPTLANDIAEGEKSNKQIVRDTLLNTGINAGFNAIGDIASLGKAMKNSGNPITADDAFRANALEGYEKLKNYELSDDAAKNVGAQIDNINTAPEIVNAGKATHIKDFYDGVKPNAISNAGTVMVSDDAYNSALKTISDAQATQGGFKAKIRAYAKEIFDRKYKDKPARKVVLNNVDFDNGDYVVEINYKPIKESIDKGHLSPEKLATYENLDEILANSEYVDSGTSRYHGTKNKDNVIRYDYFETPVTINGKNFIATCDVEVTKEANSYKLHKIVNEINLVPMTEQGLKTTETAASLNGLTAGVGKSPDLITGVPTQSLESSLSDLNVPKESLNVNKNSVNFELPEETFDKIDSHFEELARPLNEVQNSGIMNNVTGEKALTEWANVNETYSDYLDKAMFGESVEEVEAAKKALDNARKRYARAMKDIDPEVSKAFNSGSFGYKIGRPLNERNVNAVSKQGQEAVDAINELENFGNIKPEKSTYIDATGKRPYAKNQGVSPAIENEAKRIDKWIEDQGLEEELTEEVQEALNKASKTAGADQLQFFAEGDTKGQWKTSKFRTNTMENTGWLKDENDLPTKDYAYRVFTEAEQKEAALERFKDSQNVVNDLMNTDRFDEVDVKAAMNEMQRLLDDGSADSLRQARRLGEKSAHEARESGRAVQALAEYNKNSASGALNDAFSLQDENVAKWKSKNKKKAEGNSRIAKALSDMGNKWRIAKDTPELTHEQIKAGVRAELDKELGSASQYFNDNDLEYLTILAENKNIPVWQITDEIEHKLNFGDWYTLDESIPEKLPTNTKLNNALNSLIEGNVRAEKSAPSLEQITNEVRNTIGKESASFAEQFSDEDIDYLANLINNGASKDELSEALNLKLSTGTFGISDQALQDINNIFKEISKFDVNSKQFVEGQVEAYKILANELNPKATALEKFDTWRYLAMLGNPKTMLRNFVGNQTFSIVTGISNNLAALGEAGVDRAIKAFGGEGIQRTKAILNPIQDAGLIKASNIDADASRYRQIIGSKYEKIDKNAIKQAKSVFNSKLLQLYEKATDAGISDYSAVKNKYSTSLAGYLKANGYDANVFNAETELARLNNKSKTQLLSNAERDMMDSLKKDVEALEKGRDFALRQAEYATFHEDNAVANLLTKWSKEARNSDSKVANAMGVMIEGTVPFKKTPANILRSGVEYSPLGAIDSIKKTGKLVYENTGKRAGNLADVYVNSKGKEVAKTLAADVIDSWAKTLTGTGLTALGMYLYNKGIIRVSDPDTKYQDQLEGIQNYSIEINGKTYTMDWSVPSSMPLFLGAEIAKVNQALGKTDAETYESIEDYMGLANRLAEPMVETSMLQGVKDTLETAASTAAYDGTVSVPTTLMYNMATGYATQAIPTLSGQIARTVDNTRRSTYSDKNGAAERTIDKQGKKILNKIPYLSKLNEPYVDTYGREQKNNPSDNFGINLAYQMLSPGYYSEINTTDADRLSREVYGYNKTESVLPKYQTSFKDAEGNRVSPKDFTTASKAYGKANKEIRDALAKDAWFKKLDNGSKEEIVKGINTLSEHVGKAAIDSKYSTTSKAYNTYKQGGIPGLVDYYKKENAKDVANQTGFSSASNASKVIQKDVQNGNMKAAEQKIDAATQISNLGLDKPGPTYTYYNAQKTIPDLTPEKFVKTYKSIDSDGNQGIKQDEIINYLNNNNISESEGKKIWSAYGNSSWKSIPSLKDGKWSKSRK